MQQAATLGEAGLSTVALFRPLSRAAFSYLHATELLAQPQVWGALKAKAASTDLVGALRTLSPRRMLEAAHGGKVPKGLLLVLNNVSETRGLTEYDAKRVEKWLSPSCNSDKHRGRLLREALQTWMQHNGPPCLLDFSLMVANIRDLPEHSLDLLRLRELRTIRELTQKHGGADRFEVTINYVANVCSTFKQHKDQIAHDLRAGKPLGAVLRQILEDHADDLPKPWFPMHAELEVLKPKEALQLAVEWQNCIREVWIDPMLAGDITFIRSKAYLLVARLRRVTGQNGHEMWLLEETAAPNNEMAEPGHIVKFVLELQRGNVVAIPEQERICDFMRSVIARRQYL